MKYANAVVTSHDDLPVIVWHNGRQYQYFVNEYAVAVALSSASLVTLRSCWDRPCGTIALYYSMANGALCAETFCSIEDRF